MDRSTRTSDRYSRTRTRTGGQSGAPLHGPYRGSCPFQLLRPFGLRRPPSRCGAG